MGQQHFIKFAAFLIGDDKQIFVFSRFKKIIKINSSIPLKKSTFPFSNNDIFSFYAKRKYKEIKGNTRK